MQWHNIGIKVNWNQLVLMTLVLIWIQRVPSYSCQPELAVSVSRPTTGRTNKRTNLPLVDPSVLESEVELTSSSSLPSHKVNYFTSQGKQVKQRSWGGDFSFDRKLIWIFRLEESERQHQPKLVTTCHAFSAEQRKEINKNGIREKRASV